jgi:hypothetical protein
MSKPQRIDDHSFWAGARSKDSVFPKGVHIKEEKSADGAGAENQYEDTTEAIRMQQEMGARKAKANPLKSGYRN